MEKQETSLYYPVHQVHSLFTATFLRSLEALYMNRTISGQASARFLIQSNKIADNFLAIINFYLFEILCNIGWRDRPLFIVKEQQHIFNVVFRWNFSITLLQDI